METVQVNEESVGELIDKVCLENKVSVSETLRKTLTGFYLKAAADGRLPNFEKVLTELKKPKDAGEQKMRDVVKELIQDIDKVLDKPKVCRSLARNVDGDTVEVDVATDKVFVREDLESLEIILKRQGWNGIRVVAAHAGKPTTITLIKRAVEPEDFINSLVKKAKRKKKELTKEKATERPNPPRHLSISYLNSLVAEELYHRFPGTNIVFCCLKTKDGFSVIGQREISPFDLPFSETLLRNYAREDAICKLWDHEFYRQTFVGANQ